MAAPASTSTSILLFACAELVTMETLASTVSTVRFITQNHLLSNVLCIFGQDMSNMIICILKYFFN